LVVAAVVALVAGRFVDAAVRGAVATHFLAARGGGGADRRAKQRACARADHGALRVAANGLSGQRASACAEKGARARALLLFRACTTRESGDERGGEYDRLAESHHVGVPLATRFQSADNAAEHGRALEVSAIRREPAMPKAPKLTLVASRLRQYRRSSYQVL